MLDDDVQQGLVRPPVFSQRRTTKVVRDGSGMAETNRRTNERQRIRRQVLFRYVKQLVFNVDATGDISSGGLFIATMRPLVVGAQVVGFLRADNKGEVPSIRFDGEVAWRSPRLDDSAKGPGIGVRFTHLDPDSRQRLDQMLSVV